jgi:hypothetical protein
MDGQRICQLSRRSAISRGWTLYATRLVVCLEPNPYALYLPQPATGQLLALSPRFSDRCWATNWVKGGLLNAVLAFGSPLTSSGAAVGYIYSFAIFAIADYKIANE